MKSKRTKHIDKKFYVPLIVWNQETKLKLEMERTAKEFLYNKFPFMDIIEDTYSVYDTIFDYGVREKLTRKLK